MSQLSVSASPGRGIVLVLASGLAFTLNDTVIKWLRADYPVGELLFLRGIFSCLVFLVLVQWLGGWRTLRVYDWRSQGARAVIVDA